MAGAHPDRAVLEAVLDLAARAPSPQNSQPWRWQVYPDRLDLYAERDRQLRAGDPDGRIPATFEIVWLSGWTPHESQQKPLRPGSARTRLADALGVKEGAPAPRLDKK